MGVGGGKYKEQELIAHSDRVVHKVVGFISLSKTWALNERADKGMIQKD